MESDQSYKKGVSAFPSLSIQSRSYFVGETATLIIIHTNSNKSTLFA